MLANGSMASNQRGAGEIRERLVEEDLVDCMVALPGQLFYSTQIPACLWFLARDRRNGRFRGQPRECQSDRTPNMLGARPGVDPFRPMTVAGSPCER